VSAVLRALRREIPWLRLILNLPLPIGTGLAEEEEEEEHDVHHADPGTLGRNRLTGCVEESMDNAVIETVLDNADIRCDGATEVVYYGEALPWVYRSFSLLAYGMIYSLFGGAGAPTVRVFAQWSPDGVTWANFSTDLASWSSQGVKRGTENTATQDYGPFVRFNVGIVNTTATEATARLTVKIKARFFA
jgi:hypothetical protein